MVKFCEGIVNVFSLIFFDKIKQEKTEDKQRIEYTLSSVFPTESIMCEVKKYI